MNNASIKTVAIVPARGGSKGVLRKNLRDLCGKPLVSYSIQAGLDASLVDAVYVSTENEEIAEIAKKSAAGLIPRPQELASDTAQNDAVIANALEWLNATGIYPDNLVLLQPTSPLRTAKHIDECLEAFNIAGAASAMSVCHVYHHPGKCLVINDLGIQPFTNDYDMEARRQDMDDVYQQNGAVYVVKTEVFRKRRCFYCRPCIPYLMERRVSIDIDNEIDLKIAELTLLQDRETVGERSGL
ncbi:cytidylyltransferase domain-containing protein [Thalassospira australica]|uniref:acylneuraminate cytidylyltransferase family protein n=1 Tax=Thalassospira australica TaxID=1528106 RepID=UPI000519F1BC|nr:acylneuraminate cytidylyltransferase family protein [Thalassospira australica]